MKFKLVTLDLDGTLFQGNSVLFLRDRGGVGEGVKDLHERFRRGEISEKELNYMQMPYLEGIKFSALFKIFSMGPLLQNISEGVRRLKKSGVLVSMLTFNPLQFYFREYGIDASISKSVEMRDDEIARVNDLPENKVEYLKSYCSSNSIPLEECVHVGDGLNDIPTFKLVGLSIALNPASQKVSSAATIALETSDFLTVAECILKRTS